MKGVCAFKDKQNPDVLNVDECRYILDANDKYLQSWAYWDSFFYHEDTQQVNDQLIEIFSRVYPRKTNGIPKNLYYNTSSRVFEYHFALNSNNESKAGDLATEIFIPSHAYPYGFQVELTPNLQWAFDKEESVLIIRRILPEFDLFNINFKKSAYLSDCTVLVYSVIELTYFT